jgi:hypothetical protein
LVDCLPEQVVPTRLRCLTHHPDRTQAIPGHTAVISSRLRIFKGPSRNRLCAGARVVDYSTLGNGQIWLLIAYTKAKFDDLPAAFLNQLREENRLWIRKWNNFRPIC